VKSPYHLLVVVPLLLLGGTLVSAQRAEVLIYSTGMTGFAQGISEALEADLGDQFDFIVVNDSSVLQSLLPMPNVACLILPVYVRQELSGLIDPLGTYFKEGGAMIGFQGCCSQGQAGKLAREVFPAFGNATGTPTMKNGIPVNQYVRDQALEGFGDLPEEFDLLGQFFTYPSNISRKLIEPQPEAGHKWVLYRERKTGAPLVIAYENDVGSRSISLTGCFVRSQESARNYYGKLLESPNFLSLLEDSLLWTLKGSTRYNTFSQDLSDLVKRQKEHLEALRAHASDAERTRRGKRTALLTISWLLGLIAIALLVYEGFFRGPRHTG